MQTTYETLDELTSMYSYQYHSVLVRNTTDKSMRFEAQQIFGMLMLLWWHEDEDDVDEKKVGSQTSYELDRSCVIQSIRRD